MLQSNADQAYSSIEEYFLAGAKPSDAHIYFSSLLTTLPSFFSLPNRPWCASDRTPYTTLTSFSANRDRRDLSQCIPLAQSNWLGCGVARKEENPPPCLLNDIKNICLSRLLSPSFPRQNSITSKNVHQKTPKWRVGERFIAASCNSSQRALRYLQSQG